MSHDDQVRTPRDAWPDRSVYCNPIRPHCFLSAWFLGTLIATTSLCLPAANTHNQDIQCRDCELWKPTQSLQKEFEKFASKTQDGETGAWVCVCCSEKTVEIIDSEQLSLNSDLASFQWAWFCHLQSYENWLNSKTKTFWILKAIYNN